MVHLFNKNMSTAFQNKPGHNRAVLSLKYGYSVIKIRKTMGLTVQT